MYISFETMLICSIKHMECPDADYKIDKLETKQGLKSIKFILGDRGFKSGPQSHFSFYSLVVFTIITLFL